MTAISTFAVLRLKPEERYRFFNIFLPWAVGNGLGSKPIMNVYWEEELHTDVDVVLAKL